MTNFLYTDYRPQRATKDDEKQARCQDASEPWKVRYGPM